ncbi:MAG: hypothetical protein NZZ41_04210 [Candidatus Dojkabacteria bacterium]|nr:hypothetical protein [Candidatus Dojkabacteria bacterium]
MSNLDNIFKIVATNYDLSDSYPLLTTIEGQKRLSLANEALDYIQDFFPFFETRKQTTISTGTNSNKIILPTDIYKGRIILNEKREVKNSEGNIFYFVENLTQQDNKDDYCILNYDFVNDRYELIFYPDTNTNFSVTFTYQTKNVVRNGSTLKSKFDNVNDITLLDHFAIANYIIAKLHLADEELEQYTLYWNFLNNELERLKRNQLSHTFATNLNRKMKNNFYF